MTQAFVSPQTDTRALVVDYVRYYIRKHGLNHPGLVIHEDNERTVSGIAEIGSVPNREVSEVQKVLRLLGDEVEGRYLAEAGGICDTFHIQPSTANVTFTVVINNLFVHGGVNWGRIVSLFVFSGALAARCVEKEMPFLVDQVIDWTAVYLDSNLGSWIASSGGWAGLVKFSRVHERNAVTDVSEKPVGNSLRTLCGYTLGAVGVLALGACFVRK